MNENYSTYLKHLRRVLVSFFGIVALALTLGCDRTSIVRVTQIQNGVSVPVASADVYVNNTRIGQTDSSGVLSVLTAQLTGANLVARKMIFERPGFRLHHDPTSGPEHDGVSWTERVYLTSMEVDRDGLLHPQQVTDAEAQQELVIRSDNTLIGIHFLVSVVWDASDSELQNIGQKFQQAGAVLYNATDGQIYFEQVDIIDDNLFWHDAEFHWHADSAVWPSTSNAGGLLVPSLFGSVVELARSSGHPMVNNNAPSSSPQIITHEFGHFGFGLLDEYSPIGAYCTNSLALPFDMTSPLYGTNMPKASCIMFASSRGRKFCSDHRDNPHHLGGLQASNCWDSIVNMFSDHINASPQWTLKTPMTRDFIPGQVLPGLLPPWQASINIDNRASAGTGALCPPFDITLRFPDGTLVMAYPITLAVGPRLIAEGPTGSDGSITIVGAHVGDRVWTGLWRNVVATPSAGPGTCGAP